MQTTLGGIGSFVRVIGRGVTITWLVGGCGSGAPTGDGLAEGGPSPWSASGGDGTSVGTGAGGEGETGAPDDDEGDWDPSPDVDPSDAGTTTDSGGDGSSEGSTGGAPPSEPSLCEEIVAQWVDLGAGVFEVDFDGAGVRPPARLSCEEPTPGSVALRIEADAFNVDVAAVLGAVAPSFVHVLVPDGVVVGSYAVDEAALTTGALSPEIALTIAVAGRIAGAGGEGGFGGVCGVSSQAGGPGGVAIGLPMPATVLAAFESDGAMQGGEIWGGGGGGGGGGDGCDEEYCGGTGAGGGGAGALPGLGGEAQNPGALPSLEGSGSCGDFGGTNWPGGDGTADAGGLSNSDGDGGAPGQPGHAGHPGQPSFQTTPGMPGGAPGCAFWPARPGFAIDGGDVRPTTQDGCHGLPR